MKVNYYDNLSSKNAKQIAIFDVYVDIGTGRFKSGTEYIHQKWEQSLQFGFDDNEKEDYQRDKKNKLSCIVFSGCYDRYKSKEPKPKNRLIT